MIGFSKISHVGVISCSGLNVSFTKRFNKQDLPTADSPNVPSFIIISSFRDFVLYLWVVVINYAPCIYERKTIDSNITLAARS